MSYRFVFFNSLVLFFVSACQPDSPGNDTPASEATKPVQEVRLHQAQQFRLLRQGQMREIQTFSSQDTFRYRLGDCSDCLPYPLTRVVCNSTTTAAMLRALEAQACLVGITQGQFLYDSLLYARWEAGEIADLGQTAGQLSYEKLLQSQPQLFLYHGSRQDAAYRRLQELDIPVLFMAEQLEPHPLGRAEWLRLVAELLGKADMAAQQFETRLQNYEALAKQQYNWPQRPKVLLGLPYQGSWFMPGRQSFVAQYIRDAGGHYLFEHLESKGNTAVDWEVVYALRDSVEVWVDVPFHKNLTSLKEADARYADFQAFAAERVYSNAKRQSAKGGYDIFESAVLRPDVVLRDFVQMLHPEAFPEQSLFYYQPLRPQEE